MSDSYDYPFSLFCAKCNEDVDADVEDRIEHLEKGGKQIDAPYKVAVCPKCKSIICERDREWVIIRVARKEGFI